jgi:hypothetical protein
MNYRIILTIIIVAAIGYACKNKSRNQGNNVQPIVQTADNKAADTANYTTVQWLDSAQQFGKVTDGEKVLISFHFKNTGNKPLVISDVTAGCGCTVPEKPEDPIAPGEQGVIKAEFNSSGRVGPVSKNLSVTCNTVQQNYTLIFDGEVLEKKQTK